MQTLKKRWEKNVEAPTPPRPCCSQNHEAHGSRAVLAVFVVV